MCVIADDEKVLGIGGIMGGEDSGSSMSTNEIFLESAYFDPVKTAITGRKLNIMSDSRYRFERGVDPNSIENGLKLAARGQGEQQRKTFYFSFLYFFYTFLPSRNKCLQVFV